LISVNNICVSFAGHDLFKDISFQVNDKDRIGLIGKNGVGKSTLLKIIAGWQQPDSGKIVIPEGENIGYLAQEIHIDSDKNILEETLSVFKEVEQLEKDIAFIEKELETRTDYESDAYTKLITDLTEKHERLAVVGGADAESEAEKVLKGLGFKPEEFTKKVVEFSGGWQMRIELAKLLLQKPTLMLLDEPTNHLDIESIMWLEQTLIDYPGAIMMVSHDRMFLDNVTNRTVEIVFGKIYNYKASYSKFFELRAERLEHQKAAFENQQDYIKQQEAFITRFKAKASKAKAAQSKMKALDKLERIEFDEIDTNAIKFRFPPAPRSGTVAVEAKNLSKSYDKTIFSNLNFQIERGERVALVGQNGQGKSTLIKLIVGEENYDGELVLGHNVNIGYYAQVQEKTLNENATVLQTIEDVATGENAKDHKIRALLGGFLFREKDIDKRVKVLSGGEKSRLALAKLLLEPVSLLILDEPTNHLDIASKEVLKEALMAYDGTLVLVSHDRDFLQGLTNKTFEFKDKKIKEHIGPIDEFLNSHTVKSFRDFEASDIKNTEAKPKKEKPQNNYKQDKDQEKKIQQAERTIEKFEKQIADMDMLMADPDFFNNKEKSNTTLNQYSEIKKELDKAVSLWEQLLE
jgi:ATP-binding cassette subfamily F protein 3